MNKLSLPRHYFTMSAALFLERIAYFGFRAILMLLLTKTLLYDRPSAQSLFSIIVSTFAYLPVVGGFIADTLLRKKAPTFWACLFISLGSILVAFSALSASKIPFIAGAALFVIGESIFKPAFYTKLTQLYSTDKTPDMAKGFLYLIIAMNFGGLLAPIICGYTEQTFFQGSGFLLVAGLAAGALMLLKGIPDVSASEGTDRKPLHFDYKTFVMILIAIILPFSLINELRNLPESKDFSNLALYTGVVGVGTFGALLVGMWWSRQSRLGRAITVGRKFIAGGIISVIGSAFLFAALDFAGAGGPPIAPLFTVAIIAFEFVDLFISPVALAFVSQIAPERYRATVIGGWFTLTRALTLPIVFLIARLGFQKTPLAVGLASIALLLIAFAVSKKIDRSST